MVTEHRLMCRVHSFRSVGVIPVDANPVHFAAAADLVTPHDWHVVLRLTGHYTGRAAGTLGQIDHHSPTLADVGMIVRPEVRVVFIVRFASRLWILAVSCQRTLFDHRSATSPRRGQPFGHGDLVVLLRTRQGALPPRLDQRGAIPLVAQCARFQCKPWRCIGPHQAVGADE